MKVELGSWTKREGWITVDKDRRADICMDLTHPLPFSAETVSHIYSSHLLEHFPFKEMIKLLQECHRVLRPGGVFEAAVPNARIYIEAYQKNTDFKVLETDLYKPAFNYFSRIDFVNYFAYLDGLHHFMFDEENLPKIVSSVGFRNVHLRSFNPELDMAERDHETIYVEGEK
jgi:predicted SAM-dependent methyltransferase